MAANAQLIVVRRKDSHTRHHGGAWKVAYADFVTAMMALFIVLWLMNCSHEIQQAVSGYFKDPAGTGKLTGTTTPPTREVNKDNLDQVKTDLEKAIRQIANFDKLKNHIELTVTSEGLRIELLESQKGTFFDSGQPEPNANGRELLITIAEEVGKVPNKVLIEGHTDSQPFAGGNNYSNWELSADRANASRRLMQLHGLRANQVAQVRGFADQQPRNAKDPADPSNRRITMIVKYLEEKPADLGGAAGTAMPNTVSGRKE
ncbi:MAG TPA: flagellar motor protein MotB [Candidatus Binatia bacterium]|nr:flagellar motor protein MotB [Candidatus Binatia bacterium]